MRKLKKLSITAALLQRVVLFLLLGFLSPVTGFAAVLTIDPPTGSFMVGSTIEVPIWVNSEEQPINAIAIDIKFPPEKLQLISPSIGRSIITLWTAPPSFNNQLGTVSFQGVIPNGITTSKGLITVLSFRVKAPSKAYVQFGVNTKVLKHDGIGTDVLTGRNSAVYDLILPPPAGPIVASQTHPDSSAYYSSNNVILSWVPEDASVSEYSYVFTDTPLDHPDNISEGSKTTLLHRNIPDGRHYFHIKSYRNGVWGGTTHFLLNIDTEPPAEFSLNILPKPPILRGRESVIQFQTTDTYSGIDYYELKIISLEGEGGIVSAPDQPLFVEAISPHVLSGFSETGRYDVVVRAFDRAGNMRESSGEILVKGQALHVTTSNIEFIGYFVVPWWVLLLILLSTAVILWTLSRKIRERHKNIHIALFEKKLPKPVAALASDLKEKQKTYVRLTQLVIIPMLLLSGIFGMHSARAEELQLEAPIISTLSREISNKEIFYVGGTTALPGASITLYIKNIQTGETAMRSTIVDKRGEWFYQHDSFLSAGEYALWSQESFEEVVSPPSPQERLIVYADALQFGFSRVSYATLYVALALLLFLIILALIGHIVFHHREGKRKLERWQKEVREAEESVRRGFAVLKRDILAELDVVRKMKLVGKLRAEELGREEELLRDLEWVELSIAKEISDIEKEL